MKRVLFVLLLLLLCSSGIHASLVLQGDISTNTTLLMSNNPHQIRGTVRVLNGATLTLEPGVNILFEENSMLEIQGSISAMGTVDLPIWFHSSDGAQHYTKIFMNGAEGSSFYKCAFSRSRDNYGLLRIENSGPVNILNCDFDTTVNSHGIYIKNSHVVIDDIDISNVAHNGIQIESQEISENTGSTVSLNNVYVDYCQTGVYVVQGNYPALTWAGITVHHSSSYPIYANIFNYAALGSFSSSWEGIEMLAMWEGYLYTALTLPYRSLPYYLLSSLTLDNSASLTLEPGTGLRFPQFGRLQLNNGSSLSADGTELLPISFRAGGDYNWGGIVLDNNCSALLDHCQFSSCGFPQYGSPEPSISANAVSSLAISNTSIPGGSTYSIYVSGDSNGTVTLDNVNIHDCPWTGLNILDKSITLNYSNLSITDCGRPIAIPPNLLNFLDEQPLFTDNTDNRIFLHSDGYLNRDTTVRDWGYPYVCESINIDVNYANLIINPGCEFQMGYSQGFNVTGSISAVGTSTDPILFNRLPGSTQNWRGFYLNSGTSYAHFDHCILQNCASSNQYSHIQDAFTIYRADTVLIENTQIIDAYCRAVYIESNDSDNDDLVINNLSVDGCGMDAVYQSASGYNLTINGLSVNSCNAFPLSLSANWAHQISGITLTNNAHNVIRFVYGGSLASQTLANHGYPYQISGGHLYVNYTNVTLLPGTVFYFELEKGLEISGTLNATGTPDQPIVFDRPPGATYFWERIYLSNNASASFANCQFLNCGRRNPNGYDNAFLDNAGGALLSLQNCLISNVDAQAISCHDGGSGDTTQINNVQINGCRTDGFLCNDSDYTLSVNNLSVTSCLRNPISILACQAGWIDNLTLNGNANNDIRLFDYNGISGTVHFPNHGYVYRCESGIMGIGGSNVSFAPGCIFWISDNRDLSFYGAVSAIGTAAQPIIFTRNPASTGNWLGVRLYNGNWDANFVYCQILYGGQNDTYNQCRAFSNYGCDNLNVSSCLIRYSPGEGMYFENMAASDVVNINNLTIRDVAWNGIIGDNIHYHDFTVNGLNLVDVGGYPIYFSADLLDRFSGVTFSGIGNPNIYVSSYTQTRSATWPGFGYPFRLKSSFTVNYSTTLTIPAGSELQWPDNSAFYVYGAIQAVGTEAQPIVFTRYPASTGYWQGICLHSGCWDADFVYCQILYGGQIDAYNKRRALGDYGCDNLNLNNSLIRYSYGDGIYFENMQAGDVVSINELTMRDIAWSGYVGPYIAYHNLSVNGLHFIDLGGSPINVPPDLLDRFAGVTFSGIGDPKIYVSSYPQSRSATWPNFGLPYYFNNSFSVNDWVTLTISAGTELVFANYILYEVNTNFIVYGALNTLGTEAQPVIFRGLDPNLPSTWVGLRFENPDYPCNLNYTTVMNAGLDENHTYAHEYCALYINGGSVNLSGCRLAISNHNLLKLDGNNSTTLSNCLLDSAVNGIIHNQGILNLYNNNIMALSGTGIFQNGGTLNFGTNPGQWNRLYGNTLNLRNNTAAIVNAPYIYWGSLDPDPIDALIWDNEEGSTVVNYEPWYDVNCLQLNYYSLDTPTGFAVGQQTPTTLRLSWNAVPAATSYKVLTAQDPYAAEWTILQQNISGTQIDLDINPALGKCFYKVVAER